MKKVISVALATTLLLLVSCSRPVAVADFEIVPKPQQVLVSEGEAFLLNSQVGLAYVLPAQGVTEGTGSTANLEGEMKHIAEMFSQSLKEMTGIKLLSEVSVITSGSEIQGDSSEKGAKRLISFELGLNNENSEAYNIAINEDAIRVKAVTCAGLFRATQTLIKMVTPGRYSAVEMPAGEINDWPRFGYRGFMLDVCRHFSDVDMVKRVIDMLALHQQNYFHWHLSEDQGWRIEIKSHPELTEVGAWRVGTMIGKYHGQADYQIDSVRHGGYFTQEQVKEIIDYAAERYITVVPEIDLPGHTCAVLASNPSLGCEDREYKVAERWGVIPDVICAGNPESLLFFYDVMDEICELFPSPYIHLGGDECPKDRWKECPKCQKKIAELGLTDGEKYSKEDYLQSWFMSQVAKYVQSKGKRVIGWDEILEGAPMEGSVIMSWRGIEGGIAAARLGHDAIMSPVTCLYFDKRQTLEYTEEEALLGGYTTVQSVYDYEPLPAELTPEQQKHIIGVQANLWTEYTPTEHIRQYLTLPRLAALAEVQWTMPELKDYNDFLNRLPRMLDIYSLKGWTYAPHVTNVSAEYSVNTEAGCLDIKLIALGGSDIYYTLDGSDPLKSGILYEGPFQITESAVLKVVARRGDKVSEVKQLLDLNANKATFKPVKINTPLHGLNVNLQHEILTDGLVGSLSFEDCKWMGCLGTFECVIDLQEQTPITRLTWTSLNSTNVDIYAPTEVEVAVSTDNQDYKLVAQMDLEIENPEQQSIVSDSLELGNIDARYVKLTFRSWADSSKASPKWVFLGELGLN